MFSVSCFLSLLDLFTGLVAHFLFFLIYIFIFPFSLFVSVYVYVSLCDFVCICLLLPSALGFYLFVFSVFVFFSLPFLLSHVASRVLVLQPGVGPEPQLREISSELCDHLEVWERDGGRGHKREEIWRYMYMYS